MHQQSMPRHAARAECLAIAFPPQQVQAIVARLRNALASASHELALSGAPSTLPPPPSPSPSSPLARAAAHADASESAHAARALAARTRAARARERERTDDDVRVLELEARDDGSLLDGSGWIYGERDRGLCSLAV